MNNLLVSHLPAARHIINGSLDSIIHLIRSVQTLQILSHISHTTLLSVSHITEREGHITYAQEYLVFTSHVLSRFSKSLSSLLRSHVHSFLHISCFHFASKRLVTIVIIILCVSIIQTSVLFNDSLSFIFLSFCTQLANLLDYLTKLLLNFTSNLKFISTLGESFQVLYNMLHLMLQVPLCLSRTI